MLNLYWRYPKTRINYRFRPLYNTSMLAKILEKACLRQITRHLSNFEAIPKYQSVYRKLNSVKTVIKRIYNDLIIIKATGSCTMLVMIDLTAAFDTVEHSILLIDLKLFIWQRFLFDKNLTLIQQLKNTKKKNIGNLINISRIKKFINFKSIIKLIHGLVLSNNYAGLPNLYLHQLQNIIYQSCSKVNSSGGKIFARTHHSSMYKYIFPAY